ncbi:hypothetical protein C2G38_2034388 [Gigaspora rosea]|uniref:Uncharacterized protein n=1 Tax=Gigaspora rosea TaxID=44941 RepID=A0A397VI33_9GLOM|nr:hypothetical protein C2G38_2034388 [Gigaspora rosea]
MHASCSFESTDLITVVVLESHRPRRSSWCLRVSLASSFFEVDVFLQSCRRRVYIVEVLGSSLVTLVVPVLISSSWEVLSWGLRRRRGGLVRSEKVLSCGPFRRGCQIRWFWRLGVHHRITSAECGYKKNKVLESVWKIGFEVKIWGY